MSSVNKDNYVEILRREFSGEDGSFILALRPDLEWDEVAYARLIQAMEICCNEWAHEQVIDRWLAKGFWYIPGFVKDWTSHPSFPRVHPDDYYEQAYEQLWWLADQFFVGEPITS